MARVKLTPELVEQTRSLSMQGRTQRQIAAATGLARATVGIIQAGKIPPSTVYTRQADVSVPLKNTSRCPECGGLVVAPCQLCKIRKEPRVEPARDVDDSAPVS